MSVISFSIIVLSVLVSKLSQIALTLFIQFSLLDGDIDNTLIKCSAGL